MSEGPGSRGGFAGRLGLAAVSLLITLALLEGGLRALGYEGAAKIGSEPSLFWKYDALLGWSHEPGSEGTYVGPRPFPIEYRTPVRINSLGLRGPELEPLPEGGVRVLMLGDSWVAGFEVTYEETFVALAQKRLASALGRPVQIVNAGVRGYGTDQCLLYFRERGRLLEPQLVVYVQSNNDADDNMTLHRLRRPFGKPAFSMDANGALAPTGYPVPDYPICSAWGLDADFQPRRLDGVAQRALCQFQLRFADHSALFTFVVNLAARNPQLLQLLRQIGGPGGLAARPGPAPQLAGFVPLQSGNTDETSRSESAHALTTALVRQLAAEVRASGADFIWIVGRRELERLDRAALARDGLEPDLFEATPDLGFDTSVHFRNDSHLNWRGHYLASRMLTPLLEQALRETSP